MTEIAGARIQQVQARAEQVLAACARVLVPLAGWPREGECFACGRVPCVRVSMRLDGEEMFLANYADLLTDAPLDAMIERFAAAPEKIGAMLAVPPQSAFHLVDVGDEGTITSVTTLQEMPVWENGGYFVLRPEIFDHLPQQSALVEDVLAGLAREGRMLAYRHRGFWQPADTIKERTAMEAAYRSGNRPWMRWDQQPA